MDQPPNRHFEDEIRGALDWWRLAGIDVDALDEPVQWLAEPETDGPGARPQPRPVRTPPPPPPPPTVETASLPADLSAFIQWWMSEPLIDDGRATGRVPPRGNVGAELMIVVEEPEPQDAEQLLSGAGGKLVDAMLAAFGIEPANAYIASALPRPTPGADWQAAATRGLGRALAHHVALVRPRRLLVLGSNVLPLLGHEPPQQPAVLRSFNHEGTELPMLATWALPALLQRPRAKATLWRAWLEWTGQG